MTEPTPTQAEIDHGTKVMAEFVGAVRNDMFAGGYCLNRKAFRPYESRDDLHLVLVELAAQGLLENWWNLLITETGSFIRAHITPTALQAQCAVKVIEEAKEGRA